MLQKNLIDSQTQAIEFQAKVDRVQDLADEAVQRLYVEDSACGECNEVLKEERMARCQSAVCEHKVYKQCNGARAACQRSEIVASNLQAKGLTVEAQLRLSLRGNHGRAQEMLRLDIATDSGHIGSNSDVHLKAWRNDTLRKSHYNG